MKIETKRLIENISEFSLSLFFPNRCKFCDKVTQVFDDICDDCRESLPWIDGEICEFCGTLKDDCTCNGRHGDYYEGIVAPLYYADGVRSCIHRYKFRDEKLFYRCLADLMTDTCIKRYEGIKFDYITYIPLRKTRERNRGYNQSRLLAKRISENLNIPLADDLLIKIYDTKIQHTCRSIERKGNLIGAFDFNKDYDVIGKTVLIVDDVKTTGATLSECGKMLYLNDAEHVYCLTAALGKGNIEKKSK